MRAIRINRGIIDNHLGFTLFLANQPRLYGVGWVCRIATVTFLTPERRRCTSSEVSVFPIWSVCESEDIANDGYFQCRVGCHLRCCCCLYLQPFWLAGIVRLDRVSWTGLAFESAPLMPVISNPLSLLLSLQPQAIIRKKAMMKVR